MTTPETPSTATEEVRDYYDLNTARWFARPRDSDAIHRAVWGEGVRSQAEAFRYVDRLVLRELEEIAGSFPAPLHVLDLGCGIGNSLIFLASHAAIRGTGITLSGVQAEYAARHIQQAGLAGRVECLKGDFLELPKTIAPAQLAFSIEAFVHSPDPEQYFTATAGRVVPGGLLVVCDDFISEQTQGRLSGRNARLLDDVRTGWLARSLVTPAHADECARRAGYRPVKNLDLTKFLDLRRPRDLVVAAIVGLGRHLPLTGYRWRSLVGGNALQAALVAGLIEFRFVVWQRVDTALAAGGHS
jgi:cyclopropane fatty-acyl-phospholipid synthase-like methyltransferase